MIKFIHTHYIKMPILLLIPALFLTACKKDKAITRTGGKVVPDTGNNKPIVSLPDEIMFVGSTQVLDSNKYTIYLLDAGTGQLVTKYDYPTDGHSDFCKPFARKGILYDVERNKIRALAMNTGAILWTDSLDMDQDEHSIILHDDTFYGIYYNHTGTAGGDYVYALDATKKSATYLWKTPVLMIGNVNNLPVNYYNSTIYITNDGGFRINALDAKTGVLKWTINSPGSAYSMASLNYGVIIADHTIIDAASGNPIATVTDPAIPPITFGATQTSSSLNYVTNDLLFVETTQTAGSLQQSFLSAIDRTGGTEKWRANFGSHRIDAGIDGAIDTTKNVLLVWDNKLIVEGINTIYSGHSIPYGIPILTTYTGSLSTLDINTGLFETLAGGESSNSTGRANYDGGNLVAGNIMYGNYIPNYTDGINVYATDLLTGQLKWRSKALPYSGIFDVFSCVYSRSQDKAYSPYINVNPHARAGAVFGQTKNKALRVR